MSEPTYDFYAKLAKILNSGKSKSVILSGNVYDLFWDGKQYLQLVPFLLTKTQSDKRIQLVYELNGPIRMSSVDKAKLLEAWIKFKSGAPTLEDLTLKSLQADLTAKGQKSTVERYKDEFEKLLSEAMVYPGQALELLRQFCICSRATNLRLLIFIEGADMLIPAGSGDIAALADEKVRRIAIVQDWFTDPAFVEGKDCVCLITESRSQIHPKVSKMPQVSGVEVSLPNPDQRQHYTDIFCDDAEVRRQKLSTPREQPTTDELTAGKLGKFAPWGGDGDFARQTGSLTIYALREMLMGAYYSGEQLQNVDVTVKIEEFLKSMVGDDAIEFKKPSHTLKDVVGNTKIKNLIGGEIIRRIRLGGKKALSGCIVAGALGCHKSGQGLLMFDGSIKPAENVVVGDELMGPDSTPRKVLQLIRGNGRMVRITPIKGKSFVVNEDHLLTLVRTRIRSEDNKKKDTKAGEIIDVSVKEWMGWSRTHKIRHKMFRSGVEFSNPKTLHLIDPYFLGCILGDGSVQISPGITTADAVMKKEIYKQAKDYGLRVDVRKNRYKTCPSYFIVGGKNIKNPLTEQLRSLGLWGIKCDEKFIPISYKTAKREDRLQILAGLIDTDGSYCRSYDFISKSRRLSSDVSFLARSLGFAAYMNKCKKKCQTGAEGIYWRVSISGNLELIPCRIKRKKATVRKQKKSVLRTGFTADYVGKDNYYGFTLSGDGRYLLSDFTVTHNSGKSFVFEAMAAELGIPVIVLKNLRSQWYGQTDVIFERLRRVLEALDMVCIFVDEADTAFGGVGEGVHETERRLTGKIQNMMSDPALKGKVFWLLMTARVHLLSPDMRRPERGGDLIIPVLDPEGQDRTDFIKWAIAPLKIEEKIASSTIDRNKDFLSLADTLEKNLPPNYSAAAFSSLRSYLDANATSSMDCQAVLKLIDDLIPPPIGLTREYQTLQAMYNCTRKSMLPDSPDSIEVRRAAWEKRIKELELMGIS